MVSVSRFRGRGAAWVATVVATTFLSGCFAHEPPMMSAPPPEATASPDGTALSGTFDDGIREGEEAAEDHTVAGYFVLGAITAPLIVLCIIGLANSKGGSGGGGGCGGGSSSSSVGPGVVVVPQYLPSNAQYRTNDYVTGYNQGYERRLDERQGHAFAYGLVTGAAITILGVVLWVSQDNRQKQLENEAGNHASAGGRRGGAVLEF